MNNSISANFYLNGWTKISTLYLQYKLETNNSNKCHVYALVQNNSFELLIEHYKYPAAGIN